MNGLTGVTRRTALAILGLAFTILPVRRDRVGRRELRFFRLVNDLPESLYAPAKVLMQAGALGAAPATAAVAYAAGKRTLAARLVSAGTITWALAKVVKRVVGRGRPHTILTGVHCRGREARGLGYLSGHAAVSAALAAAAAPHLSRPARRAAFVAAPLVGLSRIYVGAHLPLDVVGGAALGLVVEGALGIWNGDADGRVR